MTDEGAPAGPHEMQRRLWAAGDYPAIARLLMPISVELVDAVAVGPDDEVLDVGVGDGNTAVEAARRGATVSGIDLTPLQIERAEARVAAEELAVDLRVADAEQLPFPDDTFTKVVSVLGVIFAPDHARATAELARVCRPGGTVALTSWATDGWWHRAWRERAVDLVPPPPPGAPSGPDPDAWGDPAEVEKRLQAAGLDASVEQRPFSWSFPSAEAGADHFLTNAGPFIAFAQAAAAAGNGDRVRTLLIEAMEEVNQATDGTCLAPAPYLLGIGVKP